MRRIPLLLCCVLLQLVLSPPANTAATEVAGKWGVGFSVGDLIGTRAEGSILRGRSSSTVWILDVSIDAQRLDFDDRYSDPDTTVEQDRAASRFGINMGPRWRRFTRPDQSFSPYWDLFAHGSLFHQDDYFSPDESIRSWGSDIGLDFGAEYFFQRWPVSAAVHTTFLTGQFRHEQIRRRNGPTEYRSSVDSFSGTIRFAPNLQLRAYF